MSAAGSSGGLSRDARPSFAGADLSGYVESVAAADRVQALAKSGVRARGFQNACVRELQLLDDVGDPA